MQQLNYKITLHANHIRVYFDQAFEQEDLKALCNIVIPASEHLSITETMLGADRLSCRFNFQQHAFQCHFEIYSQSCWIEAEYPLDEIIFERLAQFLNSLL